VANHLMLQVIVSNACSFHNNYPGHNQAFGFIRLSGLGCTATGHNGCEVPITKD